MTAYSGGAHDRGRALPGHNGGSSCCCHNAKMPLTSSKPTCQLQSMLLSLYLPQGPPPWPDASWALHPCCCGLSAAFEAFPSMAGAAYTGIPHTQRQSAQQLPGPPQTKSTKGQSSGALQSAGHSTLCFGCFGNHHADPEASEIECQLTSEAFAGMVLNVSTPALATQVSTHATQVITQLKVLA